MRRARDAIEGRHEDSVAERWREKVADWPALWSRLVLGPEGVSPGTINTGAEAEKSSRKARELDSLAKKRTRVQDPLHDFVASRVDGETTVLDIGAGTGKWSAFLAPRVRRLTALDPSPSMLGVLRENVAEEGIENVDVVQGSWPEVDVAPHDVTLCSHAIYSVPNLVPFLRRMVETTRRTCFLVVRSPLRHGLMAEASMHVRGHPFDGPNFIVAYNVLLDMGIRAKVLADPSLWDSWVHSSMEEAVAAIKRRLKISRTTEYDSYLRELLGRHLLLRDGRCVWPKGVRSMLLYWDVDKRRWKNFHLARAARPGTYGTDLLGAGRRCDGLAQPAEVRAGHSQSNASGPE